MGSEKSTATYKDVEAISLPWSKRLAELLVRGSTRTATGTTKESFNREPNDRLRRSLCVTYAIETPVIVIHLMGSMMST